MEEGTDQGSSLGCSRLPWSSLAQSSFVQVVTEEQEEVYYKTSTILGQDRPAGTPNTQQGWKGHSSLHNGLHFLPFLSCLDVPSSQASHTVLVASPCPAHSPRPERKAGWSHAKIEGRKQPSVLSSSANATTSALQARRAGRCCV